MVVYSNDVESLDWTELVPVHVAIFHSFLTLHMALCPRPHFFIGIQQRNYQIEIEM